MNDTIYGPERVHGVQTPEDYRALGVRIGQQTGRYQALSVGGYARVFVNTGRWLVRCECGNGPSAGVTWNMAVCFDCGHEYQLILPEPDLMQQIELVLSYRDIPNRNWEPTESLPQLRRENREHNLPTGIQEPA